jgi:hypothetical protein
VAYVVIGGMAVIALVPYRTTRDLDILIEPTPENARRVREAVRKWLGVEPQFAVEDFLSGDILSFGGLLRVEVHTNVPGVTWEQVWGNRRAGEMVGVATHFASIDDLIAMKTATGRREKDQPDVRRLRRLKQKRDLA